VCNVFHHTNDAACTQGGWKIINGAVKLKEQSAKPGMIPGGLEGIYREINSVCAVTCRVQVYDSQDLRVNKRININTNIPY